MQSKAERPEEAQLSYPFARVPAPGEVFEVAGAPGARVRWLRMGLPFALDHINLWLLEDEIDGTPCWTAVDTGVGLEPTRAAWEQVFATGLEGRPIKRVIITHAHPDHLGNADWLCARFADHGCRLTATAGEYLWGRVVQQGMPGFGNDALVAHFRRHGLAPALCDEIERGRRRYFATLVPAVPDSFHRMRDGDTLTIGGRSWLVHCGYGHSTEHASLFCPELDLVISGDMLLPRISTNIAVSPNEPDADPLKWFLDSICLYERLPADVLVLPSHGRLFRGARARVAQLRSHHDARLAETLAACEQAASAGDILPVMFPRGLDAHQATFAIGEALAHLHYLRGAGEVSSATGADGVIRFSRR
ncbi:MAG: MBL fold metallo-hydrolase [Burkholderiales bacterium]|nr:MBL fold metallo-hydrolase [Burkholderiales bacterium]